MRGILAEKKTSIQLLAVFLLALFGYALFFSLAMGFASAAYNLSVEDITRMLRNLGDPAYAPVLRFIQGFVTLGVFLFPALVGSWLISHQPERLLAIDYFPRPVWLFSLVLIILAYSSGSISDLLYQLSSQLQLPEQLAWLEQYLHESQALMEEQYRSILQMHSIYDFAQTLVVMALLPAIAEEALFRGLIQPLLVKGSGRHFGIILTALIFALLHSQFLAFLSIWALGILLGYLRYWTRSLWVPTLVHFVNNGAIVVMVYFFSYNYAAQAEGGFGADLTMMITLIAIFVICLLLVRRLSAQAQG